VCFIIIIIIIRYVCLLSQAFLPGTSLEPAVIPTAGSRDYYYYHHHRRRRCHRHHYHHHHHLLYAGYLYIYS